MKHGTEYPDDLVEKIGDLQYDVLTRFLSELAEKLYKDSEADAHRGRPKLASALNSASYDLYSAATEVAGAWRISEQHMN